MCCAKTTLYTEYKSLRLSLLQTDPPTYVFLIQKLKTLISEGLAPISHLQRTRPPGKRTKRLDLLPTEVNAKFPTTEVVNKVKEHLLDTE